MVVGKPNHMEECVVFIKIYGQDQDTACGELGEHDLTSYHETYQTKQSVQIVGINGLLRQPRSIGVHGKMEKHEPGPFPARDQIASGCIFKAIGGSGIMEPVALLQCCFRGRVHRGRFLVFDLVEKGERYQPAPFLTTDLFLALWRGRKRLTVETDSDLACLDAVLQWNQQEGNVWFDAGPWGQIDGAAAPTFFRQQFSMVDTMIEMMRHLERSLQRSLDRDFDVSEGLKRAARAFWEHTLLYKFLTELGYCDPRH